MSLFPGHNCSESLTVAVCMHTDGYSPVIVACTTVDYVIDKACSISHFLKSNSNSLTPCSHKDILDQFDVTLKDLQLLDRNMMLCFAHEDLTPWNLLGSFSEKGKIYNETFVRIVSSAGLKHNHIFTLNWISDKTNIV